ncbi:ABC transporter ATP-binding protein [uncultured Granulicatella sp.]|uniref:ABC transporter ATP-binding protein n=1 Tax=uncultured Granulicatella sp. TaxID=316089 RepID=UPI0028D7A479|nr:ABC transporter ATP-binding protein [uncultured Granulicatella sp.]
MKTLWKYASYYKKESLLAPLFKLLEASFELFVPLVMAQLMDVGIAQNRPSYILTMCGLLMILAIIGLVVSITAQYFAAKSATGFAKKLRYALLEKITTLDFSTIDQLGTDSLITKMTSDIQQVQTGWNLFLRLLLRSPFVVLGAMIMAFIVNVQAAWVFVVTIPVLVIIIYTILLKTIPLFTKVQEGMDRITQKTMENLTGVRVLRAFNRVEIEQNTFQVETDALARQQKFVSHLSSLTNPITMMINIAIIVLLQLGAVQIDTGILTKGQVIALVNYMSQILLELIKLANLTIQVTRSVASAKRIEAILTIEQPNEFAEEMDSLSSTEERDIVLSFENVSLKYEGDSHEVLENLTFSLKKGETLGIIGGTGSGKTSLISLIPKFYLPTSGTIRINGQSIETIPTEELRQKIGIVPQKAVLFRGTIAENLRWGNADATTQELYEALEIAQAKEMVEQKPNQLEYILEQEGRNLSGGQKQRLTIARAIVRKPEILILDDSFSALDYATDAALRKAIAKAPFKPTTIIVSQRAASVMQAHQIIVMDKGKIVGIGTHEELLETNAIYQEITASQFQKEEQSHEA